MPKKLIKKGESGLELLSNTLLNNAGINFSNPSIYPDELKLKQTNNLNTLFPNNILKANKSIPTFITQTPSINKISSNLLSNINTNVNKELEQGKKKLEFTNKFKDFTGNLKEFANSDMGKNLIGGAVDAASNAGLSALGKQPDALSGGINTVADALGYIPGWGQVAKYGLKALNFADQALGSSVKGFSGNTGISGYQDFSTQGKDFRLSQFGSKNQLINQVNQNKNLFANAKTNVDDLIKKGQARTQSINNTGLRNKGLLDGGYGTSFLTAKNGATLEDIRNYIKLRQIKNKPSQNRNLDKNIQKNENFEIQKFQNGGSVIPSGALHKNKHNLEQINLELDGEITKKGIPVISYAKEGEVLEYEADGKTPKIFAEGGEVIQHAEIEKEEVILNLSLTKKLIELMKKNDTESQIEAGRILSIELIENTQDNSGIIEKILENEN